MSPVSKVNGENPSLFCVWDTGTVGCKREHAASSLYVRLEDVYQDSTFRWDCEVYIVQKKPGNWHLLGSLVPNRQA